MKATALLALLLLTACSEPPAEPPPDPPSPPNVAGEYDLLEANGDPVSDNEGDTCNREYLTGTMALSGDSTAMGRIVSGRTCNGVISRTAARYEGSYSVRVDSTMSFRGLGDDDTRDWRYLGWDRLRMLVRVDHTQPWDTLTLRRQ